MRVLHLGLDFFVDPLSQWAGQGAARLSDDRFRPWRPEAVHEFLSRHLGLDPARPRPGALVRDHQAPFDLWRRWIEDGTLTAPFDLVHVDAHSNLGSADAGWFQVLGRLAHLPVERRRADPGALTPENYLLFALAQGWLRSLTQVTHAEWTPDVLPVLLAGGDPSRGQLQLRAYDPHLLERAYEDPDMVEFPPPVARDPAVPYRTVPGAEYRDPGDFDRLVISHAEKYTPAGADMLLPLLGGYLTEP